MTEFNVSLSKINLNKPSPKPPLSPKRQGTELTPGSSFDYPEQIEYRPPDCNYSVSNYVSRLISQDAASQAEIAAQVSAGIDAAGAARDVACVGLSVATVVALISPIDGPFGDIAALSALTSICGISQAVGKELAVVQRQKNKSGIDLNKGTKKGRSKRIEVPNPLGLDCPPPLPPEPEFVSQNECTGVLIPLINQYSDDTDDGTSNIGHSSLLLTFRSGERKRQITIPFPRLDVTSDRIRSALGGSTVFFGNIRTVYRLSNNQKIVSTAGSSPGEALQITRRLGQLSSRSPLNNGTENPYAVDLIDRFLSGNYSLASAVSLTITSGSPEIRVFTGI